VASTYDPQSCEEFNQQKAQDNRSGRPIFLALGYRERDLARVDYYMKY
jgi:hypothetical protein